MSLTLLLLRHAKSSWDHPGISDFDRPVTERGLTAIAGVAGQMADAGYLPQRILCSTAQRARETLAAVLPRLPDDAEITLTRKVYEAEPGDLLELIHTVPGAPSPLLIVGHNPGIQELANLLVTEGNADARLQMAAKYPPSALAVIELPIRSWDETGTGSGSLVDFLVPQRQHGQGRDDD